MKTYDITTLASLKIAAQEILAILPDIDAATVLALRGDLGAGKTAFTKEIASLLGVTETVTSPTFVVMKQYAIEADTRFDQLVHIDAYRLEALSEAGPLRLEELFQTPRTLVCVEWPEKIAAIIPASATQLLFELGSDETRNLSLLP